MEPKEFDDIRANMHFRHPKEFAEHENIYTTPNWEILKTLTFNTNTQWTDPTLPEKILDYGKIPPLGIKKLHEQGSTGKGVNVAIIDQPLALDHPEYKGKIKEYKLFMPKNYVTELSSMHGPAVTSLLVGENIGVAPKASVYYAACPSWLKDAKYEAMALEWILKINKSLPSDEKIKFVSVSAAPGDKKMRTKNHKLWNKLVEKAEKEGIVVVECTPDSRFVSAGYVDFPNGEFQYGYPKQPRMDYKSKTVPLPKGEVFVPNSLRTVAESYDNKNFTYQYNGSGGLSWGIPFATGVLALGQQANKTLSAMQLKNILVQTAENNNGIINPSEFVRTVNMFQNKTIEL